MQKHLEISYLNIKATHVLHVNQHRIIYFNKFTLFLLLLCVQLHFIPVSGLFWSSSALSRPYHYINERMSWPEAQSYCRERFTDLATVDSMDDVNRLVNIVDAGYSGSVWIGLKRGTQKRWGWSNGENTTSQYYNWASGQPNEDGDCVATYAGVWHDMLCSYKRYFCATVSSLFF
uniref:C-type lectin domain-containing protein n=1 Tax=Cyprinus carpio TaxID=7962 RepID=A0A8C1J1Y9_CYPCA